MSKKFDYSKHPRIHFLSKRERIDRVKVERSHSIFSSSLINGSDEMSGYESLLLSRIHSI